MKTVGGVLFMVLAVVMSNAVFGEVLPLVPMPSSVVQGEGAFAVSGEVVIVADDWGKKAAAEFQERLSAAGLELGLRTTAPKSQRAVRFVLNPELEGRLGAEGYTLSVTDAGVRVVGARKAGLFYGMQTLLQLLPASVYGPAGDGDADAEWSIPCVEITDVPRFQWRGMHLDVCRHFMPAEFVKKYIDLLAMHKMNTFHWHLTEDQGWRIEIKKYPKLTEVGAWRAETIVGHNHKPPRTFDGTRHGGFYTQDEIREIVEYARQRYVNVVPEIEMPGHVQAAIAAYPQLGTTGRPVPVLTWWGGCEEILNVDESTVAFMQDVLTEVLELFPSEFIHIGGDEVSKQPWKDSPRVQARMKELGIATEEQLQSWFIHRMDEWLTERGRRLVGWDEILEGGLAGGATVMSWRGEAGGIKAAQAGHDVVMAPTSHTYFDFYQGDPASEPLAYPKRLTLETVYSYDPVPAVLDASKRKHILGVQAQIWTEYVPDWRQAEYQAYPRGCALAEVAWSPVEKKDYDDFLKRLEVHLKRLERMDVNFRKL